MRTVIAFLYDDFGAIHAEYFVVGVAFLLAIFASITAIANVLNLH
jgi:hypothetical protein